MGGRCCYFVYGISRFLTGNEAVRPRREGEGHAALLDRHSRENSVCKDPGVGTFGRCKVQQRGQPGCCCLSKVMVGIQDERDRYLISKVNEIRRD